MFYGLFISTEVAFIYQEAAIDQLGAARSFYGGQVYSCFVELVEFLKAVGLAYLQLTEYSNVFQRFFIS